MKLTDVLKKTQNKAIDNSIKRTPPSIAYKERPYKLQNESNLKLNGKEERIYNREQSGSKLEANREQSGSKLEANREQSGSKLEANREQSGSKVGAKPRAKKTGFSPLSKIIGQQKTLLILLYQECKKARMENTEALTLEYISDYTQIGKSVIKNTLQRLENKNCIMRKEYKNGRGGWTKYALRDDIFHDLLRLEKDHQLDKNNEQIDNKVGAKPRADSSLSSSISSNLVTTREEFKKFLPENWEHIETDDLSKIGFTREHLLQLCKNENLNPEIVQESINAFAFDLEENGKADRIKGSPLGYFMGILRKGLPYFPPENYEPPETRALRQYIEHKERQKTAKEELENRKFELELDEWIEKLSEEEIYQMIEEPRYRAKDSPFRRGFLSKHFKNNIYNKNGQL
jgi:DNA-binding HxlR family transcriptional regulator